MAATVATAAKTTAAANWLRKHPHTHTHIYEVQMYAKKYATKYAYDDANASLANRDDAKQVTHRYQLYGLMGA